MKADIKIDGEFGKEYILRALQNALRCETYSTAHMMLKIKK